MQNEQVWKAEEKPTITAKECTVANINRDPQNAADVLRWDEQVAPQVQPAAPPATIPQNFEAAAARLALGAAIVQVLLLASLHVLSPEFDPRWRVISEYANGRYGWVLSLMFVAGAVSDWSLAAAIRTQLRKTSGKIGLALLTASGLGSAMASVFDINHALHNFAGLLGVATMPIAVGLISVNLGRLPTWRSSKNMLLGTAWLIWISLAAFIAAMVILIVTFQHAGGHVGPHVTQLPAGTIAFNGWPNRAFVVACAVWVIVAARPLTLPAAVSRD